MTSRYGPITSKLECSEYGTPYMVALPSCRTSRPPLFRKVQPGHASVSVDNIKLSGHTAQQGALPCPDQAYSITEAIKQRCTNAGACLWDGSRRRGRIRRLRSAG